ncbi:protein phosphatase 2C domain-containing protein [Gaopeijia maritima]|uniref:PP2C family protein-serine/threonine phosphatase n=1 Tax=Gaopeijia maritima TaxID=3119007 RepID=UPI003254C73A
MELIDVGLPGFPDAPLRGALATDTGRHREHNEDAVGAWRPDAPSEHAPADAALLVADGVGGHEGGQWASRFVVDAVHDTIAAQHGRISAPRAWLDRLLQSIHRELLAQAEKRGTPTGMGSTATVALIQGRTLTFAHAGDSRAYRLRNGHLEQLTHDHSWVAEQIRAGVLRADDPEAESKKNVLTQCLGIGRSLEVQTLQEALSPGDRFLLCSDGLHGVVPDEVLRRTLAGIDDPGAAARRLIDLANDGGGPDNISAVVFDVGQPATGGASTGPAASSARTSAAAAAAASASASAPAPAPSAVDAAAPLEQPTGTAPSATRRAAPWMTGVGAVLLTIGAGAWMVGQVSARAAGAPTAVPDSAPAAEPPPVEAPVGEPAAVPAATPSTLGAGPAPVADPDTIPGTAPDSTVVAPPEMESPRPDTTSPGPAPDGARPDTLAPRDTLSHPRPE